jgi:hypothetical protein
MIVSLLLIITILFQSGSTMNMCPHLQNLLYETFGQNKFGTDAELKLVIATAIQEEPCVLLVADCDRLAQAGGSAIRVVNEVESRRPNAGSELG